MTGMTHPDVVATQQAVLLALYRRHVAAGSRYALVDFPDHANVGDSAIWLGEIAMLRAITGRDPDYVSTWDRFDPDAFRRACPTGLLFIHGGGNLGDIWPHHQRFRETLLRDVRDRPVVQLPQSIHFRDPAHAGRFADLAGGHPDFHLYVRDAPGLAFAQDRFACPVTLAPDSAFALGPQARHAADRPVLMLLRTDDERRELDRTALAGVPGATIVDWLADDPAMPPAAPAAPGAPFAALHAAAVARVARGLRLLSQGERIVTDRLHGHILATLLGIPHVALDNDYGKVSAYIDGWTRPSPLVRTAATAAEAVGLLAMA